VCVCVSLGLLLGHVCLQTEAEFIPSAAGWSGPAWRPGVFREDPVGYKHSAAFTGVQH